MTTFFTIVTNALLVVSIIAQFTFMVFLVRDGASSFERYLRVMAFTSGILVVFGAKGLGVSISELMVSSLAQSKPITLGLFGVLIPASAGIALAWFFSHTMRSGKQNVGVRIFILVGVLAVTQLADVYAASVSTNGFVLDPSLAPNVSFIVGLTLYLLLGVDELTVLQNRASEHASVREQFQRLRQLVPRQRKPREEPLAKSDATSTGRPGEA